MVDVGSFVGNDVDLFLHFRFRFCAQVVGNQVVIAGNHASLCQFLNKTRNKSFHFLSTDLIICQSQNYIIHKRWGGFHIKCLPKGKVSDEFPET